MKIFLLGLPGSGKTTLGQQLAGVMQCPFIDLDQEIEKVTGKKIREIFESQGEQAFRKIESKELKKWCREAGDLVIATGGGAPCFFDNMDWIVKSGKSIFLDVSIEEIKKRMDATEIAQRPLFATGDVLENLARLRADRLPWYQRATIKLSNSNPVDALASLGISLKK